MNEHLVNNEVLSTVIAEAVNVINNRLLIRNSDSVVDDEPLTPNHLLHLCPSQGLSPGVVSIAGAHGDKDNTYPVFSSGDGQGSTYPH